MAKAQASVRKGAPKGARKATAAKDLAETLVAAGIELFWRKGFADTNTRDIAEFCDVSPGAMYFHYKSKSELLFKILFDTHTKLEQSCIELLTETGNDPVEQVYAFVHRSAWFHAAHYKEGVVAHREFKYLEAPFYDQIKAIRRRIQHLFESVIARGLKSGDFKPAKSGGANQARRFAVATGNMFNQVAEWYDPAKELSPDQIGHLYAELALRMLESKRTPSRANLALLKLRPSKEN